MRRSRLSPGALEFRKTMHLPDAQEGFKHHVRILHRLPELRQGDLPVIFAGDFNCNSWASSYRISFETAFTDACYHLLRASGFADTFLVAGGEDTTASSGIQ